MAHGAANAEPRNTALYRLAPMRKVGSNQLLNSMEGLVQDRLRASDF